MNGFWGTAGADTDLARAGEPTNAGTAARSDGFWGIGVGATLSALAEEGTTRSGTIPSAAATQAWRRRSPVIRLNPCVLDRIVP